MTKRTKRPESLTVDKIKELLLTDEGKLTLHQYSENLKKWKESIKYCKTDFPKKRFYIILFRNLETQKIYAYSSETKEPLLSSQFCNLYYSDMPCSSKTMKFDISEYRKQSKYSGSEQAKKQVQILKKMKFAEKYDIFVSRVGSKNCPVKVRINKNQNYLSEFIIK